MESDNQKKIPNRENVLRFSERISMELKRAFWQTGHEIGLIKYFLLMVLACRIGTYELC